MHNVNLENPAQESNGTTAVGWVIMGIIFLLAVVFSGTFAVTLLQFLNLLWALSLHIEHEGCCIVRFFVTMLFWFAYHCTLLRNVMHAVLSY